MDNMPTVPSWTYQGRLITDISDMPKDTYGFIYEVKYKPTDTRYIGKKVLFFERNKRLGKKALEAMGAEIKAGKKPYKLQSVSYTHLRAHETKAIVGWRGLREKK